MTGLEDIVYEGRNKAYGSYVLRKQYPKNLVIGFAVGFLLVIGPVIGFFVYKQFEDISELNNLKVAQVDVMQLLDVPRFELPTVLPPAKKSMPVQTEPVIDANELKPFPPKDSVMVKAHQDSVQLKNKDEASLDSSASQDTLYYAADQVEQMASFAGGEVAFRKYLVKNFVLPPSSAGKIAGKVTVEFVVGRKGNIIEAKIINGLTPDINNQVLRLIVGSPSWTPATRRGNPVTVVYSLTLNLKNY